MAKLPYLNIGCGSTWHKDWVNIDFQSSSEHVIAHNLLNGIPFPDNSFEVVYHSHVLEHFLPQDAEKLIKECYRVLKPGGILRVAVPDLEIITRNYIRYLEAALNNEPGADEKYNWTMLELYDQAVRTKGGGQMIEYIKDTSRNNDDFLLERNGEELRLLIQNVRNPKENPTIVSVKKGFWSRIKGKLTDILLGKDVKALDVGRFRLGGEIHQWMYDRYSLSNLLKKAGLKNPQVVSFDKSLVSNWRQYKLDEVNEKVRKPDSLFMEATK